MLQGEMTYHLGYDIHSKQEKETNNRRNRFVCKKVKISFGEIPIDMHRDRKATCEPELIKKRERDVSAIESKVLSIHAIGMSQRDIAHNIEDIYGFSISHEMISTITDSVLPELEEWHNRPLAKCYAFVFVDCIYITLKEIMKSKNTLSIPFLGMI